jgi:hypothetical protein
MGDPPSLAGGLKKITASSASVASTLVINGALGVVEDTK